MSNNPINRKHSFQILDWKAFHKTNKKLRAEYFKGSESNKLEWTFFKWHEYLVGLDIESPFWCEKSGTKEQKTKSINVSIFGVFIKYTALASRQTFIGQTYEERFIFSWDSG